MTWELIDYSDYARLKIVGLGASGCKAIDYLIENSNFKEFKEVSYIALHSHEELISQSNLNHTFLIDQEQLVSTGIDGKNESFNRYLGELVGEAFGSTDAIFILTDFRATENIKLVTALGSVLPYDRLIVTIINQPALYEGKAFQKQYELGKKELFKYCNIVITNSTEMILHNLAEGGKQQSDYFKQEFEANYLGLQIIIYLIVYQGLIGVDFADVKTVVFDFGGAQDGLVVLGKSKGENRAEVAANEAIKKVKWQLFSPEITGVLVVICAANLDLSEFDTIYSIMRSSFIEAVEIKIGTAIDMELDDQIRVKILVCKKNI